MILTVDWYLYKGLKKNYTIDNTKSNILCVHVY